MTYAAQRARRRGHDPATSSTDWRIMWEVKATAAGNIEWSCQALCLAKLTPAAGEVRVRNLTTSEAVAVGPIVGLWNPLVLPTVSVSIGDVVVLEAKPSGPGQQFYIEYAACTVSSSAPLDIESPVVTPGQSFIATEGDPNGTTIGTVLATDNVGVTGFAITAGNTGGAFAISSAGVLTVADSLAMTAGGYTLTVQASDAAGNTGTGTVTVTVSAVSSFVYRWEDRPAYVEPNPNAAAGSPEKLKATELGITSRVNVATAAAFASAVAAATPGTQIYITSNIVGNGASQTLSVIGSTPGAGALTGGAVVGAGSAPDGTAANPCMITCAPNVWIDGGLTAGSENLNSRALYFRGVAHWWVYGANLRNANFLFHSDQCPGEASNRWRFWYNRVQNSGHAAVSFAGYFQSVDPSTGAALSSGSGGKYGHTSGVSAWYNEVTDTGLGDQRFGEAFYINVGGSLSYTACRSRDIEIAANRIARSAAEALDLKIGGYNIRFVDNLIEDCDSDGTNSSQLTEGQPGAVHIYPPYGTYDLPAGSVLNIYVARNRWRNCTASQQKFPTGFLLICHRGVTAVGNRFEDCDIANTGMIRAYTTDTHSFGDTGTIEVHNNLSRVTNKDLFSTAVGGAGNPTELANAQNNTNASNNVALAAVAGADYVVTAAAFDDDGSGHVGALDLPAAGGALDVTGANTTTHWATDFASTTVTAPVNPGPRQI